MNADAPGHQRIRPDVNIADLPRPDVQRGLCKSLSLRRHIDFLLFLILRNRNNKNNMSIISLSNDNI